MMIFRRLVGLILVLWTVLIFYVTVADPIPDLEAMLFAVVVPWLAWAFVVLLIVRRELPLGAGRFFLRMLGIDH
jgi:hypothetical protein